jgi:hypothetical protein
MAITLNGTTGITTPDITSEAGLTVDGVSFASGAPANTLVTTSGGNVGIGTSSPVTGNSKLTVTTGVTAQDGTTPALQLYNTGAGSNLKYWRITSTTTGAMAFETVNDAYSAATERMRIDSSGNLLHGNTSGSSTDTGNLFNPIGVAFHVRDGGPGLVINRLTNDGDLVLFRQDNTQEGSISVSGTTVSYNGGHLARWSQLADNTRDETILKGTVMTNLDQMAEWTTDGVTEDNEQLNCMAVSSVEGDPNVAGVFVNWDNDDDVYTNDMNIAMTGDMIIRIAAGTSVARGDLLMSAGDGTAKPQGDDIVRSKTIAKVTSTHVTCTYDDGSYCVPCVLMAC